MLEDAERSKEAIRFRTISLSGYSNKNHRSRSLQFGILPPTLLVSVKTVLAKPREIENAASCGCHHAE